MQFKLRLRARGSALVPHYGAQEQGVKRFVGRRHDPSIGTPYIDEHGRSCMSGGWVSLEDAEEVVSSREHLADYMRHVKDGDCEAADEATAALCGVRFDPKAHEEVG